MELGAVGDAYHVAQLDDALVGIEACETPVVGHVDLGWPLFLDKRTLLVDAVEKDVAHGDELRAGVGAEGLENGAGIAPAAANHAEAQRVAPRRMGGAADVERGEARRGGQGGGGFQELPA